MAILSIQSHVCFGHAGNSSALLPMQLQGHEVWPVHTVQFSNHTGYGKWTGDVFSSEHIKDLLNGISQNADLKNCDALVTGYQGSKETIDSTLYALKLIKLKNPDVLYFCDPVMGDVGRGFFVQPGIPEEIKEKLLKAAHHLSPNHFEFNFLSNSKTQSIKDVQKVAASLFKKYDQLQSILLTSFQGEETRENELDILLITPNEFHKKSTPFLKNQGKALVGTGDLIHALFSSIYLNSKNYKTALNQSVNITYKVIKNTLEKNRWELDLVGSIPIILNKELNK